MPRWPKLALFLSGLFVGGGLDHLLFVELDSPTSHYDLQLGPTVSCTRLRLAGPQVPAILTAFIARIST